MGPLTEKKSWVHIPVADSGGGEAGVGGSGSHLTLFILYFRIFYSFIYFLFILFIYLFVFFSLIYLFIHTIINHSFNY